MKILILAAHADDEVLGCGATAARLAKEGHQVVPVIVCENASVRYGPEKRNDLEEWCRASAKILGMAEPQFLRFPDQKLDTFPILKINQALEAVISDVQPEMIFTHHGGDINKDHQVIFEATQVATRPLPSSTIKAVYSYETISSTEWSVTDYYSAFQPNTFYEVSETLHLKQKAFSQYISEIRDYPHPRSLEGIEIRAKDWGLRVGLTAAEPFRLLRSII